MFTIRDSAEISSLDHYALIDLDGSMIIHDEVSGLIIKVSHSVAFLFSFCSQKRLFKEVVDLFIELFPAQVNIRNCVESIVLTLYFKGILAIENNYSKRTKVLLINPSYPYPNKQYRKIRIIPPLGLAYLGAVLRDAGYSVSILDMLVEDIRPSDLLKNININDYSIIGVSCSFTNTADVCMEIAKTIKENSNIPILFGGNHATFCYKEILDSGYVDFVLRFHADYTIATFMNEFENNQEIYSCPNLIYKNNSEIIVNGTLAQPNTLNYLPLPAYDLLPLYKYSDEGKWHLLTTRGCTHSCLFCSARAFNNVSSIVKMSLDNIIKHLDFFQLLSDQKLSEVSFSDDAFTYDKNRIIEICREIRKRGYSFYWSCNARIDQVDEELIDIMWDSGCTALLFGIESCDDDVIRKTNKKLDIEKARRIIKYAIAKGISVREMFILGLPGETNNSCIQIEKFMQDTKPNEVRFGMLSLFPGTPLATRSNVFGLTQTAISWSEYDLLKPSCKSITFSQDDVYKEYLRLTMQYEKSINNNPIDLGLVK